MRALGWWCVTFFAAANLALGACGRSWPTVRPVGDAAFMNRQTQIRTVDVLALDVEIGARPGKDPEEVADTFYGMAGPAIAEGLAARGYKVGAVIDWDGTYTRPGYQPARVMEAEAVLAVEKQLALYGPAQAQRPNEMLFPYLPARLGETTGSDATLYVGGFGYAGKDGSGITLAHVLVGVLIVVVVVVIVAAIAGGKGGGGLGSAAGNAASAAGRAVGGVARVAVRAGDVLVRGGFKVMEGMSRVDLRLDCCNGSRESYYNPNYTTSGHAPAPVQRPPVLPAGPPATAIPEMPKTGGSRTYLEMTLVDNRTGQVLWHARQLFKANPGKPEDARQVMVRMLSTLPTRADVAVAAAR